MVNKKITKWVVGLTSVAMFTGFVGLSQHYDQNNEIKDNAKNDLEQPVFDLNESDLFSDGDFSTDGQYQFNGQYNHEYERGSHIRSRAS